jgi:Fe-S cluster biogenesis protein NfuA
MMVAIVGGQDEYVMNCNLKLLKKITGVIEQHVRPSLNMDGGDIEIVSLIGNTLTVRLTGACNGCPRAAETLKYGVQKTLNQLVAENIVVVSI